jgi:hypothetical protein
LESWKLTQILLRWPREWQCTLKLKAECCFEPSLLSNFKCLSCGWETNRIMDWP